MRSATSGDFGATRQHLRKHFVGTRSGDLDFALAEIDPGGSFTRWRDYFVQLSARVTTGSTADAIDIAGMFPRADGTGNFRFGIRLQPLADGNFDLVTFLTRQAP